jgi:hypothetical protein
MSDLCGTVARMVTPKGSMSTEGETLQVSVYLTGAQYVLSAVSVLIVVQPSLEVTEGLMTYPVLISHTLYQSTKV